MSMERAWCAVYQWPGKKEFLFGTVFVRSDGPQQEVEKALEEMFIEKWKNILPDEVPLPKLKNLIPGMLVFNEEK